MRRVVKNVVQDFGGATAIMLAGLAMLFFVL
jgi:hypothetical protein